MGAMPMPGPGAMSMAWMPMCGQSWLGAAASFLGMWTVMMTAMMLPSLIPALWRYRQSLSRAGEWPPALLLTLMAAGYILVWVLLGAAVFPLGAAVVAMTVRHPALARAVPGLTGWVVILAGSLQLTRWKANHLDCCRGRQRGETWRCRGAAPVSAVSACQQGMRFGLHCSQCCASLTAVLLVTGVMDAAPMAAVTCAITLERLAPAGERVARVIGILVIGTGILLTLRAAGVG